jgi:hypothetical protein
MKNSFRIFICLIALFSLSLSACKPDSKEVNTSSEKKRQIENIHFYIETSASMAGYFKQDADFKTIIADVTTKIDKNIKPLDIWFIAETETKYGKNAQQLASDIATTKIADQKSSQLHEIIKKIAFKNDSNDISILVSDCILSFPDEDIKKNPEINKQEAPNALKGNIFSTFSDLKKKGIATSVYAFSSKFYGTYYNYQNGKIDLKGIPRPFYMWVIGNKELLGKFNAQLADISSFKPEESLHFGLNDESVSTYDIIPQIEKVGEWAKEKNGIKNIEIGKGKPVQFSIALDLSKLPEYAKTTAYLQNNLKLDANGCDAVHTMKVKSKVDISKVKGMQINVVEKATHFVIITLNEMRLNDASINLTLPLHYDTWYEYWSVDDDKNIAAVGKKTFAFQYLINGVKEAYESKNKNYIECTIMLKK